MKSRLFIRAGVLVITLVATSAVGLVTGAAAQAAVPPWQQTVTSDPNIAGTLSFYDSAGEQVFGGDTDDPFGYVVGSSAIPSGETKGALFLYRPTSGTAPGAWSGAQLTAAAPFPTTAPGDVPTGHPVVQGQAGDSTVAGFAGAYPSNDSTAGYSGVYELRLRTTRPGATASTAYDVADIEVTGTSWSVSYPFVTSPTSTSVTLGASGAKAGGSVTLTATVTPSTATGVVQFRDNGTALGSPVAVPLSRSPLIFR